MKNKKNNRLILITILLAVLTLPLNGCSLAQKNAGDESADRLIGVFITEDPLDLFDMDSWLSDHTFTPDNDTDITINNSGNYINPLYATINRHNSKDPSDWDVTFKGVRGINCFSPVWTDEKGETFHASQYNDAVCDIHTNISSSDNTEELELSATIYNIPGLIDQDAGFFPNPVYQTADGKIYAVSTSGFSTSSRTSEGDNMSTTFSEQFETTEQFKTKTEKTSVTIHYSIMFEPLKIRLFQMDKDHQVIRHEEFTPGKVPEKLSAEEGAAYILIETEKKSPEGGIVITRDLYERSENEEEYSLETFYALDNGLVSKQSTEVDWK